MPRCVLLIVTKRDIIKCMKHPIELHRKELGLSRAAFAALIGISYSLMTEIERGQRWRDGVPHDQARRIASVFGVPKETVVFWVHPENQAAIAA